MRSSVFFPLLIFVVWLVTYLLSQILFEQKLGWDEVNYMGVARGIASDFDCSARSYTVMGILKHGYPTHFINFPLFSIYLAFFFKLFGTSLKVAYFSSWLCALGVCILIYKIFLIFCEKNYKVAFFCSLAYLFFPGILKTCDSAMMEQMGCFLLSLCFYLIAKDYIKGYFNFITVLKFAFSFLIIWLYKSLFIGFFFGSLVFIFLAYKQSLSGKKIKTKFPLPVFLLLSYGLFVVLYLFVSKVFFLGVAPMMTFTPELEMTQKYADFLTGFFENFPNHLLINIKSFLLYLLLPYFVFPTVYTNPESQFFTFLPYVINNWIYFSVLFVVVILNFAKWKSYTPELRVLSGFILGAIISFNLIFNFLFTTTYENIWRYNIYSLPIYLIYVFLVLKDNLGIFKHFISSHPFALSILVSFVFIFCYLPLFSSTTNLQLVLWDRYYNRAKANDDLVKSFTRETKPKFIYFNDGIHTTFTQFPIKQVMKDATNEQLIKVNSILPEPIEFLFLRPTDWLFKNNQEQILKGKPILNDQYELYGYNQNAQLVVYKYVGGITQDTINNK